MDQPPQRSRRTHKFTPKAPLRKPTPALPMTAEDKDKEADVSVDDAQASKLMLDHFNLTSARQKSKTEKKAAVQVAFGHGASSGMASSIRSFGVQKDESAAKISGSKLNDLATDTDMEIDRFSSPTDDDPKNAELSSDVVSPEKTSKVYQEPWDYNSNYPTVLPLRRPNSGDPEILDKAEFGDSTQNMEYNEDNSNHAKDLGLLDEGEKDKMILFQFPESLPFSKQPATASRKGKEKAGSSSKRVGSLEELSKGSMGKMLVYKSGAVKLKLGETLFDVSPGVECGFAQDVTAINPVDKLCCSLGDIDKRAVVSPDVDSLLKKATNLSLKK
ncbi:hypothetical protein ACFE04_027349 [Oxalis oulophora]